MEKKSDLELIELSLIDKENFLFLMRRYEKRLFLYISRISNFNHEEIEDILQEVFLAIYRNLNNFDHKLSFSSWAYRIAHNKTISHFRFKKARPITVNLDKTELWRLASDIDLISDIDKNILGDKVLKIFKSLNKDQRDCLVLRFLEEKNYQEISDILKKPMGTVATLLKKSKESFKKEWQKNN
jgi:RNA polymerase sigma-70 factor, ECF subfamily